MYWAAVSNIQQGFALFFREVADELNVAFKHALFVGIAAVAQRDNDVFNRPFFAFRIHADGHGSARTQRRFQVLIRCSTKVVTAEWHGFVGNHLVFACVDVAGVGVRFITQTDNDGMGVFGLCVHSYPFSGVGNQGDNGSGKGEGVATAMLLVSACSSSNRSASTPAICPNMPV